MTTVFPEVDSQPFLTFPDVLVQDDSFEPALQLEGLISRALITRDQVAENAREYSVEDYYFGYGQCLKFSRMCALAPGGTYDADAAWANAEYKHTAGGTGPKGTWNFYAGGSHGHVTVSNGEGMDWTTDYRRYGRVDLVPSDYIVRNWGMRRRGWTEDINGVRPLDTNGDWFDMATKAELDDVVQERLLKFAEGSTFHDAVLGIVKEAMDSPTGLNMVREGVQLELGDENVGAFSDSVARKVWGTKVTDPVDGSTKTLGTILRYAPQRAHRIVESLGGTWK